MKKKLIIIFSVLMIVIVALIVPKQAYQKLFKKQENTEELKESVLVYLANENNELVGVKVPVEAIEEDKIKQKWDILTSKFETIPSGYSTTLTPSTLLESYEIKENTLIMNVSDEIYRSAGNLCIESLAWTFCDDEIEKINLMCNNEQVSQINEYSFSEISKKSGANYSYETSFLKESDYVTIVHYQNGLIKPVTYFYNDSIEQCDFVLNKIIDDYNYQNVIYEYELNDSQMIINFQGLNTLTLEFQNTIDSTMCLNMNIDKIVINGNDQVLYERTFATPVE